MNDCKLQRFKMSCQSSGTVEPKFNRSYSKLMLSRNCPHETNSLSCKGGQTHKRRYTKLNHGRSDMRDCLQMQRPRLRSGHGIVTLPGPEESRSEFPGNVNGETSLVRQSCHQNQSSSSIRSSRQLHTSERCTSGRGGQSKSPRKARWNVSECLDENGPGSRRGFHSQSGSQRGNTPRRGHHNSHRCQ